MSRHAGDRCHPLVASDCPAAHVSFRFHFVWFAVGFVWLRDVLSQDLEFGAYHFPAGRLC